MKIAIIGVKGMNFDGYSFGGFETAVTNLAPRLVSAGHNVTVYCRKNRFSGSSYPNLVNGVKLKYLPSLQSKNLENISHTFLSFFDIIKSRFDVVMIFQIGLGIFLPLFKIFRIKSFEHIDGLEWQRGKWSSFAKLVLKLGAYSSIVFSDFLISDADAIHDIFLRQFKSDSHVIYYGAEIRNDLKPDRIIKMGIEPYSYYLLATRFIPENNPLFIIENFIKTKTNKRLVVLGRNYYKSEYERKIKSIKDPRIIFLGHISNRKLLLEFYKYSYVYIHGHSLGGTNPTMLEALANNCSILALNTVFNQEMLDFGKYGEFFELNEKSFIEKINYLDSNYELVQKMKKYTRERIIQRYNWESVTKRYLKLLNTIK